MFFTAEGGGGIPGEQDDDLDGMDASTFKAWICTAQYGILFVEKKATRTFWV